MIIRFFLFSLLAIFLVSCSEEKKAFFQKKATPHQPFLINMQHYFSEVEDEISFPIWFDDSIVKQKKIRTLTRSIYALNQDTSVVNLPRVEKVYSFDENGTVQTLEITEYYERTKVHHVIFTFDDVKDENGFVSVKIEQKSHLIDYESSYSLYDVEQYANSFLVYKNREDGNYLFYMIDEDQRGPLSVESFANPTPNDWIVLGTPGVPDKRYQVRNRVNESNVKEINYAKKTSRLESVEFESYPFDYKRSIQYDGNGYCIGFVDSTFSMDQFLMRRSSKFSHDANRMPSKLVHNSEKGDGTIGNRQLETFEYMYYE